MPTEYSLVYCTRFLSGCERAIVLSYGEVAELVESTTLLTWQGVKTLEGSNPSLSAVNEVNKGGELVVGRRAIGIRSRVEIELERSEQLYPTRVLNM